MPIVKRIEMDTVEKVQDTFSKARTMREECNKEKYDENDIMLVRTTDFFSESGILNSISNQVYLDKAYTNYILTSLSFYIEYEERSLFEIYRPIYRSTIHFTENGLVSNHALGKFDSRDFIIITPLKDVIRTCNVRSFAGQDTFVRDYCPLSKKSYIIIREEKLFEILSKYPILKDYNIVVYKGIGDEEKEKYGDDAPIIANDSKAVVEQVLMEEGIVPEEIGSHYILDSNTRRLILEFNEEIASDKKVSYNTLHRFTEEYKLDKICQEEIDKIFNMELKEFISSLSQIGSDPMTILNELGKEWIIDAIKKFNETLEKMNENGRIPTPNVLLNKEDRRLKIYEFYVSNISKQK